MDAHKHCLGEAMLMSTYNIGKINPTSCHHMPFCYVTCDVASVCAVRNLFASGVYTCRICSGPQRLYLTKI